MEFANQIHQLEAGVLLERHPLEVGGNVGADECELVQLPVDVLDFKESVVHLVAVVGQSLLVIGIEEIGVLQDDGFRVHLEGFRVLFFREILGPNGDVHRVVTFVFAYDDLHFIPFDGAEAEVNR